MPQHFPTVADVIELLRKIEALDGVEVVDRDVPIDYGRFQARALEILESRKTEEVDFKWGDWSSAEVKSFVFAAHLEFCLLGAPRSAAERANRIEAALDIQLGLEPAASRSHRHLYELGNHLSPNIWGTLRYSEELCLVSRRAGCPELLEAGHLLLQLRGSDPLLWLFTLEEHFSFGENDPWRLSSENFHRVVKSEGTEVFDVDGDLFPRALRRLEALDILMLQRHSSIEFRYSLMARGREVLSQLLGDNPFAKQAQAVALRARQQALGSSSQPDLQHARLVAHELRNALLPISQSAKKIWQTLDGTPYAEQLAKPRQRIDEGIKRLYRFADNSVRLAPASAEEVALFAITDAIAETRHELSGEHLGRVAVEVEPGYANPQVRGHRGRLVVALQNLMRNAVQVAGEDVSLRVRVDARDLSRLLISVEDNGPGVPFDQRSRIFESGMTTRPGGSGQGLAMVRTIIEDEFHGTITCEQSELGGARFTIALTRQDAPR